MVDRARRLSKKRGGSGAVATAIRKLTVAIENRVFWDGTPWGLSPKLGESLRSATRLSRNKRLEDEL